MSSILALFILVVAAGLFIGYQEIHSQYYVGTDKGKVVIFRGIDVSVLGIPLSSVDQATGIPESGLPASDKQGIGRASFRSLAAARQFVAGLRAHYLACKAAFARLAAWKAHPTKQVRIPSNNGHPRFKTVRIHEPKVPAMCMTITGHPTL
jgi:hypothetical protein